MKLVINGETFEHRGEPRLTVVLSAYGVVPGARVAVVVNDDVLPQARHDKTVLVEGDRVEILIFAGGG